MTEKNSGSDCRGPVFRNWSKYQSFNKNRPNHSWKKIQISFLENYDVRCLEEYEQLRLIKMILIAEPETGRLPERVEEIAFRLGITDSMPPLKLSRFKHFIIFDSAQDDYDMTTSCKHNDDKAKSDSSQDVIPEKRREEKRKRRKNIAHPADAWFAQFWDAYPKKADKKRAEKAFAQCVKTKDEFDTVMAGLMRAKASTRWNRDGGEFILNATTFLNQRRFEDEWTTNYSESGVMENLGL